METGIKQIRYLVGNKFENYENKQCIKITNVKRIYFHYQTYLPENSKLHVRLTMINKVLTQRGLKKRNGPSCSLLLKDISFFLILFAITSAGVVPSGGPKMSPSTSSIVQIIFSIWSFEISEDILRNQKCIIG